MNIYVVYAIHADQCGLVIVNEWVAVVCDFDAPFICQWLGLSVQKSFLRFYSNCDVCAKFIFRLLVFFFFLLLFIFLDHSVFTDVRCSGYGWRQCQFQYGVMMGVLFIQFLFSNLYISYENRIEQKKKKKNIMKTCIHQFERATLHAESDDDFAKSFVRCSCSSFQSVFVSLLTGAVSFCQPFGDSLTSRAYNHTTSTTTAAAAAAAKSQFVIVFDNVLFFVRLFHRSLKCARFFFITKYFRVAACKFFFDAVWTAVSLFFSESDIVEPIHSGMHHWTWIDCHVLMCQVKNIYFMCSRQNHMHISLPPIYDEWKYEIYRVVTAWTWPNEPVRTGVGESWGLWKA